MVVGPAGASGSEEQERGGDKESGGRGSRPQDDQEGKGARKCKKDNAGRESHGPAHGPARFPGSFGNFSGERRIGKTVAAGGVAPLVQNINLGTHRAFIVRYSTRLNRMMNRFRQEVRR
jgi:hypothetical protein